MVTILDEGFEIGAPRFLPLLDIVVVKLSIEGNLTIKIGSSDESRRLNTQFLGRKYATDVLSFPIEQELPDGFYLGDIFICLPMARDQAKSSGISLEKELFTLMIHGILHLNDHDHEADDGEMLTLQEKLVTEIWKND